MIVPVSKDGKEEGQGGNGGGGGGAGGGGVEEGEGTAVRSSSKEAISHAPFSSDRTLFLAMRLLQASFPICTCTHVTPMCAARTVG